MSQGRALSYGQAAAVYDLIRPSYPREAGDWALAPLGPGRWRVADIGAGTGIMTRLLVAAGHEVIAVEPDPRMREQLVRITPDITAVDGSAEQLPLDDASVDGLVAAQAYHWFDPARAHAEFARVIRPGGVVAAIWNVRDETVPWVKELSRIIKGDRNSGDSGAERVVASYGPAFDAVERRSFRHVAGHTPEDLVRLLQSRSYYLSVDPRRQGELEREMIDFTRTHPALAERSTFDLPYITEVYRAVRVS
jgi:SAM-dependent methyltransferase